MSILRSRVIQKPYQLFHYYFLSEKVPNCDLSNLEFETDVSITIHKLKRHDWHWKDVLHFGFLSSVIMFVFFLFPASFLIKLPILTIFGLCFLIPLTSQFFVHALPIFCWLALFFSCGKIPHDWKPAISVKFLPALETILYGDNLSNVLATITTPSLDIFAWIPYGLIHFAFPFVVAALIFIFGPPTSLNSFGFAFGYMNLFGVFLQILFPAAPPWYKNLHGLEPANYSMMGSPGGLGRIDEILGFDMYTTAFSNSPVVFGAFPSLHSACSIMDVFFLSWLFPRFKVVWWTYGCWLWWSTMYLTHHYFFDLIGGAFLAFTVFTYTKYTHLPVMDPTKFCRWSYTEIHKVNIQAANPLSYNYNVNEFIYDNENELNTNTIGMSNLNLSTTSFQNANSSDPHLSTSNSRSNSSSNFKGSSFLPDQNNEYSNQQQQGSISNNSNQDLHLEFSNLSRSRQPSKIFLPQNHPIIEDEETSSFENSATTSVFDEVENLTTINSNTSLEEYDKKKPKKS